MKPRHVWVMFTLCLFVLGPFIFGSQPLESNPVLVTAQGAVTGGYTNVTVATATPTPPTEPAPGVFINVSRAQFEENRAKWYARGVQEYEIVVDFVAMGGGRWKLRVVVVQGKPQITRVRWINEDGTEAPSPYELTPDFLKGLTSFTVEETFAEVEDVLNRVAQSDTEYSVYYHVTFHPGLGYVSTLDYFIGNPKTGRIIPDGGTGLTVKSLKIIKSAMPGMPRSGNPGP